MPSQEEVTFTTDSSLVSPSFHDTMARRSSRTATGVGGGGGEGEEQRVRRTESEEPDARE
jgi:hypothetical protein